MKRERESKKGADDVAYTRLKEQSWERRNKLSLLGRDIAPRPKVMNSSRKKKASRSLRFFCETYFPETFSLPWSPDHLRIIAKIEKAVRGGGLFAVATPRGFGKTSLCEIACLWALFTGLHEFVVLIGADAGHARLMLDSIKAELEGNDLLLEDFPEIVYPIQKLDGIYQRAGGQLFDGVSTSIQWTADFVVLPVMPQSRASGGVIRVAGIDARIRGMKHKRRDGRSVRPTLVVLDDPQTDESARSPQQTQHRIEVLNGAILNLAGPGHKISGILPCTVIQPDDMADRILDRKRYPIWQGERTQLVYTFPSNMKLWEEYARMRDESFRADREGQEATEFYRANRVEMDKGAKVAWDVWFNSDELSAIQHAMNLLYRDERSFWSEYQNQPLPPDEEKTVAIPIEEILARLNRIERRKVPMGANTLTMFVDVHAKVLYWVVAAWEENFTGHVIDYGTYPDQRVPRFTLSGAVQTLGREAPRAGLEGAIYAGLERLVEETLAKEWLRDDGTAMRIDRCLIDANWGQSTDVVYRFCRQSSHAAVLMPSHGTFFGASSIPMAEYRRKAGDKSGLNWRIPGRRASVRQVRYVVYDTNFWKSFLFSRLATPIGDPGALAFFGRESERHRLFGEHLLAEYSVPTEGRGRKVEEWKVRLRGPDNHWFDSLVGCFVGASIQRIELFKKGSNDRGKLVRLSKLRKKRMQILQKVR